MGVGNNLLREAYRFVGTKGFSLREFTSFLADSIAIIGVIGTVFGISSSVFGGNFNGNTISLNFFGNGSNQSISVASIPLVVRLMFILVICSSIGWAFGSLGKRLTGHHKESWHFIANIAAVFFALVLVASAELFANKASTGVLPELQFFTLIGLGIVLMISRFQYRAGRSAVGRIVLANRATGLLLFVTASLALMLLLEIG